MTKPKQTVRLEPMTQDEYDAWVDVRIAHYAQANAAAGTWSRAQAPAKARAAFTGFLPQGLATPGHRVWTAVDDATGEPVGTLWAEVRPAAAGAEAFVYWVGVDEAHQGKGYGRALMDAAAEAARQLGAVSVGLQVFADNTAARTLYESLGFQVFSQHMRLHL
jgi:ribosomal protein S18 acetylase RimI-like enzyme